MTPAKTNDADVLVIGCGPGGSTAAALVARAGRRAIVLDREEFPRFHVGESLLPYNRPLFDELEVWSARVRTGISSFNLARRRSRSSPHTGLATSGRSSFQPNGAASADRAEAAARFCGHTCRRP